MTDARIWIMVAVIAVVTAALRFLPFALWSKSGKTPKIIERLGKTLPYAIMGMLVVYCLKSVSFTPSGEGFIPPLISCLLVILLQVWRRNTLLSIIGGTLCYMIMVQFIF